MKDWLGNKALTSIREDRNDSFVSGSGSDEETEVIRIAAAVTTSFTTPGEETSNIDPKLAEEVAEQSNPMSSSFGAVGPSEVHSDKLLSGVVIAGSV